MAKFQGFQVSTPSFAGAGNTSGGFNASGVFLQLMRARENRQRSAQYRQGQIETDERAKQRMLMSHDLQRTRSRELEQRKNQREQERAATVMEERTELLGDYFEALQDTARSPIQRKKQPLRYMDRSTSALNDEELESHLLASRPGLRDDTGKANAAGQALLKQYRGEQAFDVLDQDREVALVNSLIERAKQSQNPAAAMQALEVVLGRIEDDMRGVPLPDQAAAGIVSQASLNINRTAPVTSSQISGSPSDFSFFGNQRTNLDVSEQAQMQGARGALEQGLPVTSGHLDSIDPAILGENQMARSLIDEGGFRLSYDLDADGKVSRVEVVPPSQGGLPTMQLGGVADAITQKLNANTGTVAQAAGIAINRGTAGGNDTRAMGQPFTAPEPPTAERDAPGAAAVPQTGPEPPEPENYYESLRRQLKGGR